MTKEELRDNQKKRWQDVEVKKGEPRGRMDDNNVDVREIGRERDAGRGMTVSPGHGFQ